jgi:hypothetical protein
LKILSIRLFDKGYKNAEFKLSVFLNNVKGEEGANIITKKRVLALYGMI